MDYFQERVNDKTPEQLLELFTDIEAMYDSFLITDIQMNEIRKYFGEK
jgi:hypothetical protein